MNNDNKLGQTIEKLRRERNISWAALAKKSGVSRVYLHRLLAGLDPRSRKPVNPSILVLLSLADAFEVSRTEFLQQCGYLDN